MLVYITYEDLKQEQIEVESDCYSDALIKAIQATGCATVISVSVIVDL